MSDHNYSTTPRYQELLSAEGIWKSSIAGNLARNEPVPRHSRKRLVAIQDEMKAIEKAAAVN